jgi:membrane fusion protein, heavy metal efflux system
MQKLKNGMQLRVQDPFSKIQVQTKVNYISPIMNELTRTVTIRATIPSQKGTWKPGMFINGFIVSDSHTAKLRLPRGAVHSYEGNTVVFVQDEDGFEPRTVTLGTSNENYIEILTGLKVGDTFVSKNGFIVKSELGKAEMSSGHNH